MPCRSFPPKKLESRDHHRKTNTNRTVDEWSGTQGRNWEKLTVQPHTFLTAWIGSRGNLYPRPCKRALKDLSNHLRVATRGYVASTPAHVQGWDSVSFCWSWPPFETIQTSGRWECTCASWKTLFAAWCFPVHLHFPPFVLIRFPLLCPTLAAPTNFRPTST